MYGLSFLHVKAFSLLKNQSLDLLPSPVPLFKTWKEENDGGRGRERERERARKVQKCSLELKGGAWLEVEPLKPALGCSWGLESCHPRKVLESGQAGTLALSTCVYWLM